MYRRGTYAARLNARLQAPPRRAPPPARSRAVVVARGTPKRAKARATAPPDVFGDLLRVVTSIPSRPAVLMAVVLAAVFTVGFYVNGSDFLGHWAKSVKTTYPAAEKFITGHKKKIAGAAWFFAAWLSVPNAFASVVGVILTLWLVVVPEATVIEYAIQAFAVRAYFMISRPATRMAIIAAVAAAYWLGYLAAPVLT